MRNLPWHRIRVSVAVTRWKNGNQCVKIRDHNTYTDPTQFSYNTLIWPTSSLVWLKTGFGSTVYVRTFPLFKTMEGIFCTFWIMRSVTLVLGFPGPLPEPCKAKSSNLINSRLDTKTFYLVQAATKRFQWKTICQ